MEVNQNCGVTKLRNATVRMQNLNTTSFPWMWNWIPIDRSQIWCKKSFEQKIQPETDLMLGVQNWFVELRDGGFPKYLDDFPKKKNYKWPSAIDPHPCFGILCCTFLSFLKFMNITKYDQNGNSEYKRISKEFFLDGKWPPLPSLRSFSRNSWKYLGTIVPNCSLHILLFSQINFRSWHKI